MSGMVWEEREQVSLLPYKEEIATLAQSLKGVLGADVIVVDKYLNRIVNTFHYRYNSADIRINSVVGNIVTTQKLQMIYDRKYFTDCVNCPDYTTCELGGVFGTPIFSGEECIGAVAFLVAPNQVVAFQQKQTPVIDFLRQISVLISEMVQNESRSGMLTSLRARFNHILDSIHEAVAITDSSSVLLFANRYFTEFFADGQPVEGQRIEDVFSLWKRQGSRTDAHTLIENRFYQKGQEVIQLRGIQSLESNTLKPCFLYLFDKVDTLPFFRYRAQTVRSPQIVERFFGKSAAMERAKQNTMRALHNQLSILVECPDRKQADELAKILFMRFRQDSHRIVKVDCSEDEQILEAALLGHKDEFPGVLSMGNESMVYLYGIDYLPLYLQNRLAQLLRGGLDGAVPTYVRVIATSCQNLYALVKKKRFSMKLYNLISRNKISIPAVSGSPEDIHFYLEKYLERYCQIYAHPAIQVSEEAWRFLEKRRWDNGVQEIRETAERMVAQLEGESLRQSDLAQFFPDEPALSHAKGTVEDAIESQLRKLLRGNLTKEKIAEEMGVSRATLYRWIDKYGLNELKPLKEQERKEGITL